MKTILTASAFASAIAVAAPASAQLFSSDFNTDQSANFTVVIGSSTNDANANFTYDSSTHVQDPAGAPLTIPTAPSSGSGTSVLRLNANLADSTSAFDAVAVYPTVTGVGPAWVATFDTWLNYNGPALGGSGSTQLLLFGATNSTAVQPHAFTSTPSYNVAGDGFYFSMTPEGGASQDYRFYSGTGAIARNDAGVSWFGGAPSTNLNNLDAVWIDPETGFFRESLGYETAGAPGKTWITIRLRVDGTTANVDVKRNGIDTDFVNVGTATVPATANQFFVAWGDLNTGRPDTPEKIASNFALVDNLVIDNMAAGVNDWGVY